MLQAIQELSTYSVMYIALGPASAQDCRQSKSLMATYTRKGIRPPFWTFSKTKRLFSVQVDKNASFQTNLHKTLPKENVLCIHQET